VINQQEVRVYHTNSESMVHSLHLNLQYSISISHVKNPPTTATTDPFEIFSYEKFNSQVYKVDETEPKKTIYKVDYPMTFKGLSVTRSTQQLNKPVSLSFQIAVSNPITPETILEVDIPSS